MFSIHRPKVSQVAASIALTAIIVFSPSVLSAQTVKNTSAASAGRIDFAAADLPPATVEIDVSQGIFSDVFGLGDAAIAGIVEALTQSDETKDTPVTELAANELAAARQIMQLAKEVVQEVRVRVYENLSEDQNTAFQLATRFDTQLTANQWDKIVKVRDGNESVQVSLFRGEGSIRGIFVVVADGNDIVFANIVCDISPENIKKLTTAATEIGLKHGLREAIEHELKHHVRR